MSAAAAGAGAVAELRRRLVDGREHVVATPLATLRGRVVEVVDDGTFLFVVGARGQVVYLTVYGGGALACRVDGEPWPVAP